MKYIDEFRNKRLIKDLAKEINRNSSGKSCTIMEVCGTHTMSIFRFGLRTLITDKINLVSGPGCPVCVTPNIFLDKAIAIASLKNVIVATFGDMFRVPGSRSSLEKERGKGRDIRTVYSTLEALKLAGRRPDKEIVFLGVGFETTAPTVAQSILMAKREGICNYSVLCAHKTMPEALKVLAEGEGLKVDGFLLPGHVSTIIGTRPYEFLARDYSKRCAVSGFEPVDILESILMIIRQDRPRVEVEYDRIVSKSGNRRAQSVISKVFSKTDSEWRGIGKIRNSGLKIARNYSEFDADLKFRPKVCPGAEKTACICGKVLKGLKKPSECSLFAVSCTPENPVGACMVSSEGTCAAYYRYAR